INLSQGFPDFDGPRYLQERLAYHVAQGANQYAPMTGVQALREAIADKTAELYGCLLYTSKVFCSFVNFINF
ncbi:hypothetical protein Q2383_23315, partial [Escherichia coli]|nr:hypothetical protein [Escherichia coli]